MSTTDLIPNAGKPWDETQDSALRRLFADKHTVPAIALAMGRTQAGITARLERHGLLQVPADVKAAELRHDTEVLEAIVDRHGLKAVIEALQVVCDAKADHIQENWQDVSLARIWRRCARNLLSASMLRVLAFLP